ncbi:MAG: ABC transporter ATP-binding protein/permease [Firmicutes bacterium]|nr:ABC transporter ATP-binding protein/permease [Bacillota bacterium]
MFKKFVSYYRPHKKLFVFNLTCAFFMAVLALFFPVLAGQIFNPDNNNVQFILVVAGILLLAYILRAILGYIVNYWGHILGVRIQADMRSDLFKHLEKLPFKYYDDNRTGSIMTRMTNDLWEIAELSHHLPEDIFLSTITLTGAIIIIAILAHWLLALIILSLIPFMVLFAVLRRKKMENAFRQTREKVSEINANIESSISGIRVSKAYTAANKEIEKFEKSNSEFKKARCNAYKHMAIFFSGTGFFNNLLYLTAILSGALFYINGIIERDGLATILLLIGFMIQPISLFVGIFEQIQDGITGFGRFQEIMRVEPEVDGEDLIDADNLIGDIEFKNVSFSYASRDNEGKTKIIKNLSFKIEKGKTAAFVGPSGGGKTTLCHLIPRFYEIDEGEINIAGHDIKRLKRDFLRKNVGIVAQDVFLFSGTIKDNIGYGDLNANNEDIIEAAKKASIHDFIMSLPKGYDSEVGERGVKLSGGQKQRISIARAFLKNPPILILDEATSALDNVSEMQIQASLDELSKGRTTIVVAHRLSSIKHSDNIFVLSGDGIIEQGTHEELLDINGFYAHLYSYYNEK